MDITGRPNPNEAFPNPSIPSLCFIKNVVKNPRIIFGDYTYYDDEDGADQFEKHVTHFYDFTGKPNPDNKQLLIIPDATRCDLYDGGECDRSRANSTKCEGNYIPWATLAEFFDKNL